MHTTVDGRNPAPVEVGSLSHYLQVFLHPRWCHICINNIRIISNKHQSFEKRNVHVNILISSASHDDTVNPMIISNWNIFVSFHPSTKKKQRFPINIPPHLALGNLAKSPRLQSPLASLYRSFGPPRSSKLRWRGHDYLTQLVDPRPYNPRPHRVWKPERLSKRDFFAWVKKIPQEKDGNSNHHFPEGLRLC